MKSLLKKSMAALTLSAIIALVAFCYFTKPWHWPTSLAEAACTGNLVGAMRRLNSGDSPNAPIEGWPYEGRAIFLALDNTGCPKPMAFGLMHILMAKGGDARLSTNSGYTLLMLAASEGDVSAARALVARGAQINAQDHSGLTALMYAARVGNSDFVQFLRDNGADLSIRDAEGRTAANIAQLSGHENLANQMKQ